MKFNINHEQTQSGNWVVKATNEDRNTIGCVTILDNEIYEVAVETSMRRQGLATKMIEYILSNMNDIQLPEDIIGEPAWGLLKKFENTVDISKCELFKFDRNVDYTSLELEDMIRELDYHAETIERMEELRKIEE